VELEQVENEKRRLEAAIELAVRQFRERCGLKEWQVSVSYGLVKITTSTGTNAPVAMEDYMVSVSVRV
jgi:hypothetical protein